MFIDRWEAFQAVLSNLGPDRFVIAQFSVVALFN